MSGEIDRKVLHVAMLKLGVCLPHSLCALDTIMRIDGENIGLFGCRGCVFRDMLKEEFCPSEVKQEIKGLI